ncbi:MAG: hypothetical protein IJ064_00030 [Bacteroidaceae bacterium]|nr:hypothetical protein [Bacteroidaceae bacterium]
MKTFKYFAMSLMAVALCVGFASCGDDDEEGPTNKSIDASLLKGTWKCVDEDGDYEILDFKTDGRLLWSACYETPDKRVQAVTRVYLYDVNAATGLVRIGRYTSNSTWDLHVKTLKNDELTWYDDEETTTFQRYTGKKPTEIDGQEFVDLGLSTMWASCNVGANSPLKAGYYFQWGNTSTSRSGWKSDNYDLNSYYYTEISGNSSYDPAMTAWGSKWTTPTLEQMQELLSQCSVYMNTNSSGTRYFVAVGANGNFIYLPLSGAYPLGLSNGSVLYDNFQCWLMTGNQQNRRPYYLRGRYTNETTSPDINITTDEAQLISAMPIRAVSTSENDLSTGNQRW